MPKSRQSMAVAPGYTRMAQAECRDATDGRIAAFSKGKVGKESKQEAKEKGQKYRMKDLEQTTADAFLFACCGLEDTSMANGFWEWFQFGFAFFLQIAAVCLQFLLTILLYSTVVEEAENPYEHGMEADIEVLTNAFKSHATLDRQNKVLDLCRKDHTLAGAHVMVILLWLSRMLHEIMQGVETIVMLWKMEASPIPTSANPMIYSEKCELRQDATSGAPMTLARHKKSAPAGCQRWDEMALLPFTAQELRRDPECYWGDGDPMTFMELYEEMNAEREEFVKERKELYPKDEGISASEFKEELTKIWEGFGAPLSFPAREIIDETIQYDSKGEIVKESYRIVHLTFRLRVIFILLHGVTNAVLAAFVTFTSAKYLMLAGNMANVVLKAVSMQFIVTLDTLIFQAFVPYTFAKKIKVAKIVYPGTRPPLWEQWTASVCYVSVAVGITLYMRQILFGELNGFRSACRDYYIAFPGERNMAMDSMVAISQAFNEAFDWFMKELHVRH